MQDEVRDNVADWRHLDRVKQSSVCNDNDDRNVEVMECGSRQDETK